MRRPKLENLSVGELVNRFTEIALEQDDALLKNEIAKFNRLYDQMEAVEAELKRRPGDERRAIVGLLAHSTRKFA